MNRIENFYGLSGKNTFGVFCLPFGYSLAPRTFTKVLKAPYSLLWSNGMKVCYYIEDTLIIAASKAECSANVHKVIRLLGDLGFKTNYKKSQVDPVTRFGFILDSSVVLSCISQRWLPFARWTRFPACSYQIFQPFDTFNFSIVLSKRANRKIYLLGQTTMIVYPSLN